jgi:broad-specificity NMP kinase
MRTQVLFIGGRSGVGKTSAALALHALLKSRDIRHAVIEGDYLDLAHPEPWTTFPAFGLAERNLAAVWANFRELEYRRLIYTNTASVVSIAALAAAMGDDPDVAAVLLRADTLSIESRLAQRERGDELQRHVESSARSAAWLDAEAPRAVVRLDTDGKTPEQVAECLLAQVGWT